MGTILNPYTGSAFDFVHLTQGINKIPNTYGLVRDLGTRLLGGVRLAELSLDL